MCVTHSPKNTVLGYTQVFNQWWAFLKHFDFTTQVPKKYMAVYIERDSTIYHLDIVWSLQVQKREICTDKKRKPNKSKVSSLFFLHNDKVSPMSTFSSCVCVCVQTIWRRAHEAHDLCMSVWIVSVSDPSLTLGGCSNLCHVASPAFVRFPARVI